MRWHADDEIAIFNGSTQLRQYQFMGESGDPEGDFEQIASIGTIGNSLDCNYALYPYAEDVTILSGGVITFTLSETQLHPSAVEESTPGFVASTEPYEEVIVTWSRSQINKSGNTFAPGTNPMMATTKSKEDLELKFKNLCGYLKLKLYGDDVTVQSITLSGNNGEPLAGLATATMNNGEAPTLAMGQDAGTLLTLDCGDGVTLSTDSANPTEFLFVVPSQTFTKGLTITVTDTEGKTFVKSTSNQVVIDRNVIQPMSALQIHTASENMKIYYTATSKVTPYSSSAFGANIISNEFNLHTNIGVITFDGPVTSIGNSAFYRRTGLTSITIPDSVTSIGRYAFEYCTGLISITIPDSVTSIGIYAFKNCTGLTSVTIPDSVTSIEGSAFAYCTGLTSVTVPDSVTSIGDSAFAYCTGLTSVTIGNGVTSIGRNAFYRCTGLTAFYGKFASEDNRCLIVDGALNSFAPSGLTEYAIPDSVTSIGGSAFAYCTGLTSVTIGNGVTSIGRSAFSLCDGLTSVTIGNSVTSIGEYAFEDCCLNQTITIPDSVNEIGECAFTGNYIKSFLGKYATLDGRALIFNKTLIAYAGDYNNTYFNDYEYYKIPDDVIYIGDEAFRWCRYLKHLTIPENVIQIGSLIFGATWNGSSITMESKTPPELGSFDIDYISSKEYKIYVPYGSGNTYKTADGWKKYADSIVEY